MTEFLMSLDTFKSKYTPEKILDLNRHFTEMVRRNDGVNYVDNENDKCYSKMVELALLKVLGKSGAKHILVTGSSSENLKCVSKNAQGDADIMFLSSFPMISKENQELSIVPTHEPGFYKIKYLNPGKYPFVEQDGVKYLNANSLRAFEPIWFEEDIQLPLLVFESFYHEYERAETQNVASSLSWRSSNAFEEGFLYHNKHYFQIILRSYTDHVLPLLNGNIRTCAEKVLGSLTQTLNFLCLYGSSQTKQAISELESVVPEFDNGAIPAILGFVRDMQEVKETFIREDAINYFIEAYEYFENVAAEHFTNGSDPSEISHTVNGSIDFVPCISCNGFPEAANEWKKRVEGKSWPCSNTVDEILVSGFHLVPKVSKQPENDPTTSFRIAFSVAEKLLAQSLTTFQRECFRVFKMYFYEKLKREPKVLTTYHLKTVFFWVLETSDSKVWQEENRTYCCLLLLTYLNNALRESILCHYFIPESNLLDYLDKTELAKDMKEIENILDDPGTASGQTIEDIKQFYANLCGDQPDAKNNAILDNFFVESNELFDKALDQLKSSKLQNLNMNEEIKINSLLFLTDPTNVEILKFCFDLILARNCKAKFYNVFARYPPLPSPLATFTQMLLPISDEIMKKVVLPQVKGEPKMKKKFQELEIIITIASKLKYEHLLSFPMLKSAFSKPSEERFSIMTNVLLNQSLRHLSKRIFKK